MFRATPEEGVAWITGASSGIGRSLALRLAHSGFRVAVTARRRDALDALVVEGRGRITSFPGDVTDGVRMSEIVRAIEDELGPLALAVLNAGVYHLADERKAFDGHRVWTTVETNFGGTVRCLDPVLSVMLARGRGQIAIVASLAGYGGVPGSLAYGASKAALIHLAESLRLTYAGRGLTVQVVNPGFVDTAMTAPNPYPMPFMMSTEKAADVIYDGLARGGFEISFPRRLVWPMKLAFALPYLLWLPLMSRATRRVRR